MWSLTVGINRHHCSHLASLCGLWDLNSLTRTEPVPRFGSSESQLLSDQGSTQTSIFLKATFVYRWNFTDTAKYFQIERNQVSFSGPPATSWYLPVLCSPAKGDSRNLRLQNISSRCLGSVGEELTCKTLGRKTGRLWAWKAAASEPWASTRGQCKASAAQRFPSDAAGCSQSITLTLSEKWISRHFTSLVHLNTEPVHKYLYQLYSWLKSICFGPM